MFAIHAVSMSTLPIYFIFWTPNALKISQDIISINVSDSSLFRPSIHGRVMACVLWVPYVLAREIGLVFVCSKPIWTQCFSSQVCTLRSHHFLHGSTLSILTYKRELLLMQPNIQTLYSRMVRIGGAFQADKLGQTDRANALKYTSPKGEGKLILHTNKHQSNYFQWKNKTLNGKCFVQMK